MFGDAGLLTPFVPISPFSLDSFGSFTIPGCFEVFETFSGPKEFSALVRNAEDDEEEGIITGVEVVFCVRADELHADKDTRESLLKELLPTSTPRGVGDTDPEEVCTPKELDVLDCNVIMFVPESDSSNPAFCIFTECYEEEIAYSFGDP